MKHLVHRAVIQGQNVGRHLVDEDAKVEPLLLRRRVKRIEDLLQVLADVPCSVEHATGHESVRHPLLVDRGVPGLAKCQRFTFHHLGQHQVAKVLCGGVDHPNARLISRQVQVGERVAFFKMTEVSL